MTIDLDTVNQHYPLPNSENPTAYDVERIISALNLIDTDVAQLFALVLLKASLNSPSLTGVPTAPTQPAGTNNNSIATTGHVQLALNAFLTDAAGALETINALEAALGDADLATALLDELALKAPLASPALTGIPTAPTAGSEDNSTQIATTAFVQAVKELIQGAVPPGLNTLAKIALAIGNDASYSTTISNALATKAPLASPALTGTPTAPTAALGDVTTKISTTAFVQAAIDDLSTDIATLLLAKAPLASPALTGTPTAPTPAAGNNTAQIATSAFVQAAISALNAALTSSLAGKVAKSGDTMTGNLTVQKGGPVISVNRTDDTGANSYGFIGEDGYADWYWMNPGSTDTSFPNGMVLARRNAVGSHVDRPFAVDYGTGEVQLGTSSQFATALGGFKWKVAIATAAATDLNTLVEGGVYRVENPTNAPYTFGAANHAYVEVIAYSSAYSIQRLMLVLGGTARPAVWLRKMVASTWGDWAPEGGFITPAHFGAIPSVRPALATNDDSFRLQQWWSSPYPKKLDGWYRANATTITRTLTASDSGFYLEGCGAQGGLRLDGGARFEVVGADLSNPYGLKFDTVTIKDLSFLVNSTVTVALSIAFAAGDSGSPLPSLHMSNVHFVPSGSTVGPTDAMLLLRNVREGHIENVSGEGKYGAFTGDFIRCEADASSTPVEMTFVNVRGCHFSRGFVIVRASGAVANDDIQGHHWTHCTLLAVDRGWEIDGGAEGFGEWFTITHCHAYFREIAVYGISAGNMKVTSNYFLAYGSLSPVQGVAITGTSIVSVCSIKDNTIKMDVASGGTKYSLNIPTMSGARGGNIVIGAATLAAPNVTLNGGV
ncbi:pyocin knob domain-containing protein [Ciceribacter ferrooxidans]|uniref:Uncharacterized protein n=1 Tax=Ciceribacter ferrooxidans TaxID=2509717 RepID=A0A4Q2T0H7_9HYPH|nr:pyocin knob domain-containing protein [Ciceribacter ferrooxidans]RYC10178.1 hypothetical protein EUU22_19115 [Ciceribacter ferrooxidans]